MNRKQLYQIILNEEKLFNFIVKQGLVDINCKPCPQKKYTGLMFIEKGKNRHGINSRWVCNKKKCRHKMSIFKNTIFDEGHLTIAQTLELIYSYCESLSIRKIENSINISRKIICLFYQKIEKILLNYFKNDLNVGKIGGINKIVEIVEVHLFKFKYSNFQYEMSKFKFKFSRLQKKNNDEN